jgi:hypothetical protein
MILIAVWAFEVTVTLPPLCADIANMQHVTVLQNIFIMTTIFMSHSPSGCSLLLLYVWIYLRNLFRALKVEGLATESTFQFMLPK